MFYNRLIFLFLLVFSAALLGCSQEEEAANSRMEAYVLTATQDQRNLMKYQFKVTHYGKELTSKDASFLWNFGDAAGTSTEAAPVYEYVEEGERKVTVSINMNTNSEGVSERVSQDTVILVGEPSTVYNSIITARPGTGIDLLNYTLTSSAIASEQVGEGGLHYKWTITGPDGENGANITKPYPDEGEVLTGNSVNHRFKKFGFAYDVNVYIKPAEQASFDMTKPASTMYLTTALPSLSITCTSTGKTEAGYGIECSPVFDYDMKHGMNYEWTFYSINGSSVTKDGDAVTSGNAPDVTFYYENAGAKMITVKGTHPTDMIGTVEATANLTLSSSGILNPVSCFRPVDNLGNYTDATKLQWRCEAQGYYNRRENLNKPLPLTSYTWAIKENGAPIDGAEFSWGAAGDVAGGDDKIYNSNPNVKTRVDCDDSKNICTASLIFTADKYGANYLVSLKATQQDQDNTGITHNLAVDNVTINVDMPKLTGITRTTSETNPMQSIFTPTYDTVIPDNKTLNYYWKITGTDLNGGGTTWQEGNYNGSNYITDRTLTHTFSKSGNYAIELRVASNKFSDGTTSGTIDMPTVSGTENMLNFELNQQIAGSYFNASVNALTGQIRFFTDYEARVDGKPVDTTYVFTITGPTYTNPNSNTTNKVVLHNKKEFETIVPKPDSVVGTVSNNVRLIFNATYTVTLDVYNSAIYNNGNPTGGVDGATQKHLTLTNGTGSSQVSTPTIIYDVYDDDVFDKDWNTQLYAILDSTLSGTSTQYGIDRSLFTCRWQIKQVNTASPYLTMALNEPIDPSIIVQDVTYSCDNRILINAKGVPSGTRIGEQTATLTVTGPAYNTNGGGNKTHTQDVSMNYIKN